jgi:hypothetical protein
MQDRSRAGFHSRRWQRRSRQAQCCGPKLDRVAARPRAACAGVTARRSARAGAARSGSRRCPKAVLMPALPSSRTRISCSGPGLPHSQRSMCRRPTSCRRGNSAPNATPAFGPVLMIHRSDRRRSSRAGRSSARIRRLLRLPRSTITTGSKAGRITSRQMARSDRRRAVVAIIGDQCRRSRNASLSARVPTVWMSSSGTGLNDRPLSRAEADHLDHAPASSSASEPAKAPAPDNPAPEPVQACT